MAASVKNVVWNFPRFQLAGVYMRQSQRLASSKASGTAKPTAKGDKKKAAKQEPISDTPKASASEAPPLYTYEVPTYDDWYFYNLESDMSKYRIPQPEPGKP
ncbi:uncharacterized protein LOC119725634 [Patiria miniata]|uniref:Complex I-9kD n=1 Tax=Patiria miniata TaxID=46514 RepID=A0A913ZPQ2_PATMI|nr:uncharacterized protein LOC119725634 [Patiria miniata]